jgi:hypothetical protein
VRDSEAPLSAAEVEMATVYWKMLVGNPIGERETCKGSCKNEVPSSGILTNDPVQTEKAARIRLELGMASNCHVCSHRHLIISEALSHHSEFLRCHLRKDVDGALLAARKRCELIQGLSSHES